MRLLDLLAAKTAWHSSFVMPHGFSRNRCLPAPKISVASVACVKFGVETKIASNCDWIRSSDFRYTLASGATSSPFFKFWAFVSQNADISAFSPHSRRIEFTWLNPIAPKPMNPKRSFTSAPSPNPSEKYQPQYPSADADIAAPTHQTPSCKRPSPPAPLPGHVSDRSEEHTSELQSRFGISYAVFCLKK